MLKFVVVAHASITLYLTRRSRSFYDTPFWRPPDFYRLWWLCLCFGEAVVTQLTLAVPTASSSVTRSSSLLEQRIVLPDNITVVVLFAALPTLVLLCRRWLWNFSFTLLLWLLIDHSSAYTYTFANVILLRIYCSKNSNNTNLHHIVLTVYTIE